MPSAAVASSVLFERAGGALEPTEHALGPWADGRLHGGAVAGLIAELIAPKAGDDQAVAVLRVELFGPVRRERLHAEVGCARPGERLSIWDVSLESGDRVLARGTGLLAAPGDGGPDAVGPAESPGPDQGAAPTRRVARSSPFFEGIEFRVVSGDIGSAGPAAVWTNVSHWWFDDGPPSGLAKLAAVADVAYGYGLPIDSSRWLAMNLDLCLHLLREPRGQWLLLDAETELTPTGVGVGHAAVADLDGRLGRVTQSVVLRAARRGGS